MNEEPVDLRALRTPPPLAPHDYAAVRARVMSEIRSRNRSRWLIPLAAALVLAFVLMRREPPPPALTLPVPVATEARPVTAAVPPPAAAQAMDEPVVPAPVTIKAAPVRTASQTLHPASAEPMRIHIQTADPEVRIIWIVKENS